MYDQAFCLPIVARTLMFPPRHPQTDPIDPNILIMEQSDPHLMVIIPFVANHTIPSRASAQPVVSFFTIIPETDQEATPQGWCISTANEGHMPWSAICGRCSIYATSTSIDTGPRPVWTSGTGSYIQHSAVAMLLAKHVQSVKTHCKHCQRCQMTKRPVVPIHQPPGRLVATQPL